MLKHLGGQYVRMCIVYTVEHDFTMNKGKPPLKTLSKLDSCSTSSLILNWHNSPDSWLRTSWKMEKTMK